MYVRFEMELCIFGAILRAWAEKHKTFNKRQVSEWVNENEGSRQAKWNPAWIALYTKKANDIGSV